MMSTPTTASNRHLFDSSGENKETGKSIFQGDLSPNSQQEEFSPEIEKELHLDGKQMFRVIYEDAKQFQHMVMVAAVSKTEAVAKFKKTFSQNHFSKQDIEDEKAYQNYTGPRIYRWDRITEPIAFTEQEFAMKKAS